VPKAVAFDPSQHFDDMVDRLRIELKGFVHYFAQGISKEIVREFTLALLEANELGIDHPESLEALPGGFLFKEAYIAEGKTGLESFKSMHHFDQRGPRAVSAAIFRQYLRHAQIQAKVSGGAFLRPPYAPGLIFVIWLVALLKDLHVSDISLRIDSEGPRCRCLLTIPLVPSATGFHMALLSGGGQSTKYFKALMIGEKQIGEFLRDADARSKWISVLEGWARSAEARPATIIEPLVDQCEFGHDSVIVEWFFEPHNAGPAL
jgi:hypothetical protein